MVRRKQDIKVLTRFSFDAFLEWSPAERNSFSLTVKWGWTASYQTIALNSVLSDGLIKTHYLLCIFVMTFTDVLHCSGRLVISIKTYIEQLGSFISRSQKVLITFFLLHQKTVSAVFAHALSFFRKTRWNKFFFPIPCALGILGLITHFKQLLVQDFRHLYTQNKSVLLTCIWN